MNEASDGIEYKIQLTPLALEMLSEIRDWREPDKTSKV
jgi:hypothetical protein